MKKRGMYPAIVTGAIFTGILLSDLIQSNSRELLTHGLLGVIAISAMVILSVNGADLAAWGLLSIPLVTFLVGFGMALFGSKQAPDVKPSTPIFKPTPSPSKVQTPASPPPPLPNVEHVCVKVPCPATSSSRTSLPAPSTPPSSAPSTHVPPTPSPPTCKPGVTPSKNPPSGTPPSAGSTSSLFGGISSATPSTQPTPASGSGFNITPITTCGL